MLEAAVASVQVLGSMSLPATLVCLLVSSSPGIFICESSKNPWVKVATFRAWSHLLRLSTQVECPPKRVLHCFAVILPREERQCRNNSQ